MKMKSLFAAAIFVVPLIAISTYILITRPDITRVLEPIKDESWVRKIVERKPDRLVFVVDGATKDSYSDFILGLRAQLMTSSEPNTGIEVLPNPSTLNVADRFFEVDLVANGETVSLGIDRTDLYVVAYSVGNQSYFFSDSPPDAENYLFNGSNPTTLNFTSNYNNLGNRSEIDLGFSALQEAIGVINDAPNPWHHQRSLVVIIQMVSEATRFPYIKYVLRQSIRGNEYLRIRPDGMTLDLENSWTDLSERVQESNDGVFDQITIRDMRGIAQILTTVAQVLRQIAVMKFVCEKPPKRMMPALTTPSRNNISYFDSSSDDLNDNMCSATPKEMMPATMFNTKGNNYLKMHFSDNDKTCIVVEVTVNILGRDGLCVDVKNGWRNNGNPIILYPCGSQKNQQWTLKNDGTIRSLGKCLTAYGYSAGMYVMIYDCETAVRDATLWSIWPNGTISLANHPLVLTAKSSDKGTTLTVEDNTYASSQGWQPNTNLEPFVVSIVGFRDLCLQGGSEWGNIWIDECSLDNTDQQWAIYGDGTIRKNSKRDLCVTADVNHNEKLITLRTCNGGFEQRWVFRADGFISNPWTGLVMDVFNSQPELHKIILFPPRYTSNQKWLQLF